MFNAHPSIDALEDRIASNVNHRVVFDINHRRFHKVSSASFALPGFGKSPEMAVADFLIRNKMEG